jgi:hypothetical protein
MIKTYYDYYYVAVTEQTAILGAKARGPPSGHLKQVIPTCEPVAETIFDDIDL